MNTYNNTQPAPTFESYKNIQAREHITVEEYSAWRDSLPESPIDPGLRLVVRSYYKLMDERVALGNRVYAQLRSHLGLEPSQAAEEKPDAAKFLDEISESYKKMTEGCAKELPRMDKFESDGLITTYAELVAVHGFLNMVHSEKVQLAALGKLLKVERIYSEFLFHIRGLGPSLCAFLMAELNPYRAPNVSSFWAFLGLDVHKDGRGMSKRNEHMSPRWMRLRIEDGYKMDRVNLRSHDVRKKAKVVGVMSDCIIKAGLRWLPTTEEIYESHDPALRCRRDLPKKGDVPARKDVPCVAEILSPYVEIYMQYKHRQRHSHKPCPATVKEGGVVRQLMWCETSDMHRDRAAKRYMMKMFLADFWVAWRKIEGLPVTEPYAVAVLGRRPHHSYRPHEPIAVDAVPFVVPMFAYGEPLMDWGSMG